MDDIVVLDKDHNEIELSEEEKEIFDLNEEPPAGGEEEEEKPGKVDTPPAETLEEKVNRLEGENRELHDRAGGLYADLKRTERKLQDRKGEEEERTPPGIDKEAPWGRDADGRAYTEEEWRELELTRGEGVEMIKGLEGRYMLALKGVRASARQEIDEFKMEFLEDHIRSAQVEGEESWDKIKERGLAEINGSPVLDTAYKHLSPKEKIAFIFKMGTTPSAAAIASARADGEKTGGRKLAEKVEALQKKGGTGAGAGGGSGGEKTPVEKKSVDVKTVEDYNKLTPAEQKAWLLTNG